ARLHPPQVRVQEQRREEDGARLVRRVAIGDRLAEARAGVDDPVVLDPGVLVVGERRVRGWQAAQEGDDEQQAGRQAVGRPSTVPQRGSGRIWGTLLMYSA